MLEPILEPAAAALITDPHAPPAASGEAARPAPPVAPLGTPLAEVLDAWAGADTRRRSVSDTLTALAAGAIALAARISEGPLGGDFGATLSSGEAGEGQKALDVIANDLIIAALATAPVAAVASEENEAAVELNPDAPLLVAIDPLDGSSNIDTDLSVGTIFAVLPRPEGATGADAAAFFQSGRDLLAGGYVIYGPHVALLLSVGAGTWHFALDRAGTFRLAEANVAVKESTAEFAINMSNYHHWDDPVRAYVDDCLAGRKGPRERDFNMRWVASMVADAHRILRRGGIYLYPGDTRKGYAQGRLRLLYEAFPIAFLMEQAGGAATDGRGAILDRTASALHQRVPLVFGSREEVARVGRYHDEPAGHGARSPLFARRGLFI
ncbi:MULTISPECIES: class 1 fructose-bisphosphatase [unclassified Xanthobacter]|uniref:class 1 fructose-bisphosphatase n=1 Tax=unclassified Xanthobacter TaxID=2623496 RepID=UPI001EDEA410|nr:MULTISPECIES: class 1 fructose-bisphosphatase [unclassified Xanthobacter]